MTMSKDRVEFKVPSGKLYKSEYQTLLWVHFKIARDDLLRAYRAGRDVTIICRPSQFARFLIARHRKGVPNSFTDLDPQLIPDCKVEPAFRYDVSDVPAPHGACDD